MSAPGSLRLVFLGNDAWSVPPLESLAASRHRLVGVFTGMPRPGRRGAPEVPSPVASAARRMGMSPLEVQTVRSGPGREALAREAFDALVVVAYGEILPVALLELPGMAAVNLHFSLLPALRGASPVRAALLLGLEETGVTTIRMDEGLDTGDVILRAREPIRPDDDAETLGSRLAGLGGRILVETLDLLATGSAAYEAQDDGAATYAPKLGAADRAIDWTQSADRVVNLVRAMAPEPAATTTFRASPLKVYRARAAGGGGPPGEIVGVDDEGLVVGVGSGAVRLLEVGPAGRARMRASAFANGSHPRVGERLG